jgi:hypothetical protein
MQINNKIASTISKTTVVVTNALNLFCKTEIIPSISNNNKKHTKKKPLQKQQKQNKQSRTKKKTTTK